METQQRVQALRCTWKRFSDMFLAISWLREYVNCIILLHVGYGSSVSFSPSALDVCPCPCFVFESIMYNSPIPEPGWRVKCAMIDCKPAFWPCWLGTTKKLLKKQADRLLGWHVWESGQGKKGDKIHRGHMLGVKMWRHVSWDPHTSSSSLLPSPVVPASPRRPTMHQLEPCLRTADS